MNQTNIKNSTFSFLILLLLIFFLTDCKKKETATAKLYDSVSVLQDIDSNVYKTVKIGSQWWMAENLKVIHYNNGKSIAKINTDIRFWDSKLVTGGYCLFDDNKTSPGLLYNWYTIIDSNQLAPKGWHIPTDDEWKELEIHIGMSSQSADSVGWRGKNEANELKIEGNSTWTNTLDIFKNWGTNESGFCALAGGCRLFNGAWSQPGLNSVAYWWSASQNKDSIKLAWYRSLDCNKSTVFRFFVQKTYCMSIRCVKNK